MNPDLKRHLVSALNTFITGFGMGIVAYIQTAPLDPTNLGKAALFGLLLAGGRAGVKMVSETVVPFVVQYLKDKALPL